jgi:hypothetical protein
MRKALLPLVVALACTVFAAPAFANDLTHGDFTGATITGQSFNPAIATPATNQWLGFWQVATDANGYDSPATNTYAKHLVNSKVRLFQGIDASSLSLGEYRFSFRYTYQTGFATAEDPYAWVLGVNSSDPAISPFAGSGDGFPSGGTPSPISNWDVLYQQKLAGPSPFAGTANGPSLPVPWTLVDATFDLTTSYDYLVVVFTYGAFGDNATGLRAIDDVVLERNVVDVDVDVKPGSSSNPLNVTSRGVTPVAILGSSSFDVTTVDPATVKLEGVSALRWSVEDVAPYDGHPDLVLHFDTQELVAAIGSVQDGDVVALALTGNLTSASGGTPIQGEDSVVILNKVKS